MVNLQIRSVRWWVLLLIGMLYFGVLTELLFYKIELIADRAVRIGIMQGFYLAGIAFVIFAVTPILEKGMGFLDRELDRWAARFTEGIIYVLMLLLCFFLWYQYYVFGPEAVLPKSWHNPYLARFIK